jgi:hypothetical protein
MAKCRLQSSASWMPR